jgi:ribose transport system permease protein
MNQKITAIGKKLLSKKEMLVFAFVTLMSVILLLTSQHFLNHNNLDSLQTSIAPSAIIAIGMMILLIGGMFDLSVGSVMGLGGVITAIFLSLGFPVWLAILLGVVAGALIGLFNGILVEIVGINPLIATIGVMYMGRGITEILLVGKGREGFRNFAPAFINLGTGKFLGIYHMFWVMIFLVVIAQLYIMYAANGRRLYHIGGNAEASLQLGIRIKSIRIGAFVLCGTLAAFAGILSTARYEMANRYMGEGMHMSIIISCLIGGGSIAGGQGSIIGALLGVVFMALLNNSFNLLEVAPHWQNVVIGGILVLVVVSDGYLSIRKKKALGKT